MIQYGIWHCLTVVQDCNHSYMSCISVMASTKRCISVKLTILLSVDFVGEWTWLYVFYLVLIWRLLLYLLVPCRPVYAAWSQVTSTWFPKDQITVLSYKQVRSSNHSFLLCCPFWLRFLVLFLICSSRWWLCWYFIFGHDCLVPHLFQFIVHFSYHLMLCSLTYWQHY